MAHADNALASSSLPALYQPTVRSPSPERVCSLTYTFPIQPHYTQSRQNAASHSPLGPLPCFRLALAPNSDTYHPRFYKQAVMLQRYLALHTQQSSIRRQISESSSSPSPPLSPKSQPSMRASPDMSSSEPSSAGPSPTLESTRLPQLSPPAYALPQPVNRPSPTRKRSARPSIAPIPEDDSLDEFEAPSPTKERAVQINHEIKTTLTDLLNCEAVRNDGKMRLWIQSRLMDAERELKRQRRTRQRISSLPTPTIVLTPVDVKKERRCSA